MVGGELGRMVSKRKKNTRKVQESTEKVVEAPKAVEESPKVEWIDESIDKDTTIFVGGFTGGEEDIEDQPNKTPNTVKTEVLFIGSNAESVAFIDETPKLKALLDSAPAVPLITNIHEAVAFVDKYRVWKNRVKAETG